jgi:hypothetical protein
LPLTLFAGLASPLADDGFLGLDVVCHLGERFDGSQRPMASNHGVETSEVNIPAVFLNALEL